MLIRITWGLVLAGLGLVIAGFIADANALLIAAIVVEGVAIALVLFSWAMRAREGAPAAEGDLVFLDEEEEPEPVSDEELFATIEQDEEFAVGGRRGRAERRPARKPSRKKAAASRGKSKPKPRAKAKAKPKAAAKSKSKAKGGAKRKPSQRSKPKSSGRGGSAKPKQQRRRPPSESR